MRHFPGGAAGYAEYGINKAYNTDGKNKNKFMKEINIK